MKNSSDKPPKTPATPQRLELRGHASISAASAPGEPAKARTFRMVANTGEPMRLWGFSQPVVVDLASVDLSGLPVPALYDHFPEIDHAVGQVQAARVAGSELVAEGVFTVTDTGDPDRNYAQKVLAKADAGYQWQVSVGGDPASVEEVKAGGSAQVNGRTYPGPLCIARGLTLREISFVVLGADRKTSAVVAGSKGSQMQSFEEFVKAMKLDPATLSAEATVALQKVYAEEYPEEEDEEPKAKAADGEEEEDKEEDPPTSAAAAPVKVKARLSGPDKQAHVKYVKDVLDLCSRYEQPDYTYTSEDGELVKAKLADHAIENEWTVDKVKATILDQLRKDRSKAPAAHIKGREKDVTHQTLQGAMILRAGGKLDHKAYKTLGGQALLGKLAPWLLRDINDAERDRYMNAAHKFSNMSMLDLCREACRLNGVDAPLERDDMIRAAFSGGGNLSNVFTTNVNAVLLATYDEFGADTTQGWCSEVDVNDFKTNERPRVNVGDGLKKLPRGQEAEHTSYTDSVESYKIARYARQFEIDEQDIIDDNFSVFADVPQQMGRAAARLRPDLVYGAVILANPTLTATSLAVFSSSNATDNDLSATALSHSALGNALATMRIVRENSVNLNLEATHLLVPPALEDLALELTMSSGILYGADDETVRGNMNSLQRRGLQVVAEPRLQNGVTNPADETSQSGSSTLWYLVCGNAHTVEVGYLKGTGRAPRVRTTVLDKGRWGMNWDVSMDIGVKALDWKGFIKS